ncbi:MAG: hypothetical protein Q8Q95_04635 [bacterium]|nr:hypothetical protein [bacterium]
MNTFYITLSIDILGIAVGIISIATIISVKKQMGGAIGKGLGLFIWGVMFMMLAFLWTIIFTRLKLLMPPAVDIHHALMTIGMILFVVSAKKFSKTVNL